MMVVVTAKANGWWIISAGRDTTRTKRINRVATDATHGQRSRG